MSMTKEVLLISAIKHGEFLEVKLKRTQALLREALDENRALIRELGVIRSAVNRDASPHSQPSQPSQCFSKPNPGPVRKGFAQYGPGDPSTAPLECGQPGKVVESDY
jgi:hypothetical protein